MSFSAGISGLKAAAVDLKTAGNNIANANTIGFKKSRAEFGDVYASSFSGEPKTLPGSGVRVTEVAQQFTQGNIEFSENSLDLAISGNGFFALAGSETAVTPDNFTRNGMFHLNKDGFIVDHRGRFLMSFKPNGTTEAEGFSQGVFQPLFVDTSQGLPTPTSKIKVQVNLTGSTDAPAVAFNPNNPDSFNNTTSQTVYDSQGNAHIASMYFVKTATPNLWETYTYVGDRGVNAGGSLSAIGVAPTPTQMNFTANGLLSGVNGTAGVYSDNFGPVDMSQIDPTISVDPLSFEIDFFGSSQLNSPFSVNQLSQNGLPAGNLVGLSVNDEGVMFAQFSQGGQRPLGQIAMARVPNNQGLAKLGDTSWGESGNSGAVVFGAPGSNNFGLIQSAALESSNVDLSEQLVRLIIAQQAYQANAQTISTQNTITQSLLNMR